MRIKISPKRWKILGVVKTIAFSLILILAVLSFLTIFPSRIPFKPFIVLSGSMKPTVSEGSIIFVKRGFENVKPGDIITFKRPDKVTENVTHRVVNEEDIESGVGYRTKGDANDDPDLWVVRKEAIWGKVLFSIPLLGYIINFSKTRLGVILLIVLPLMLIAFDEIRVISREIKKIRKKTVIVFLLAICFSFTSKISSTRAMFADTVQSTGQQITIGWWEDETAPESTVDQLDTYQNNSSSSLTYTASDDSSGVEQVQLYYSYEYGDWQLFETDTIIDNEFEFTSPAGDGFYEFKTVAIDNAGNEEDEDGNDVGDSQDLATLPVFLFADASTTVDTIPPVTMFSVESYLAVVNEQFYNGGFESGNLDGWIVDSIDSDHQVTTDDQKTGDYSALIGFRDAFPSAEPAYDSIKQSISLPNWITSTLSFWYRLMTDSDVSGGFFDAFVTSTGSDPITVAHDGWDDPEVMEEDLGWKNVTYQLDGLEGKDIDIQFKVTQPYDNYQTWAYLDDIKLTAATNSAITATDFSFFSHDGSGSNNSTITYSVDGGAPESYIDPINLTEGEHFIAYSSEDEAGNVETEKQIDITVQVDPVDFGVVLNEILPDPSGNDSTTAPNGEWVELYNNSTNPVDVNGWKLEDAGGNQMIISAIKTEGAGTIILAGSKLKIYRRGSGETSGPAFVMNNTGDIVKLLKPDGNLVDSYNYTFSVENKSFKRDPDGTGGWKDPEAKITEVLEEPATEPTPTPSPTPETSPTLISIIESSPPSTLSSTTTGGPESILTPTPILSPSPGVSPTPTLEPSNIPNPASTPVAEPPADESVKEPQTEEPPQNQTPLPEEGNEINE